jgi:hypothetical protein
MSSPVDLAAAVQRSITLRQREVLVRESARKLELDPSGDPELAEEARRLITRANGLRKLRLALLNRCGLTP